MKRTVYEQLVGWKARSKHKPLLLRGARQIGKTHVVRQFAETFDNFIEINFEQLPEIKQIFAKDLVPQRIVRDLQLFFETKIAPGRSLLFFDEIQAAPEAIQSLRYFFEEMPELHVVAAGSLLDFALEHIGVPVGRVEFLYMYPMSFIEFLIAANNESLVQEILEHLPQAPLAEPIHHKLLSWLGIYMAVGGMPEAVQCWFDTQDLSACSKIHHQLITAYRQDFPKYAKKFQVKYLDLLFDRMPMSVSNQFKYSNISQEYRKRELMPCVELLSKAKILHQVVHTSGNGVPLGAEANLDKFKPIFLDVALTQAILGLKIKDWLLNPLQTLVNQGAITEAFIGQELLGYSDPSEAMHLYYWQRETRGSQAEIDYLLQKNDQIIPIEVKSRAGKTLKSLHLFMQSHKQVSSFGVRFSMHNYSIFDNVQSYPLYAVAGLVRQE